MAQMMDLLFCVVNGKCFHKIDGRRGYLGNGNLLWEEISKFSILIFIFGGFKKLKQENKYFEF